MLEPRLYAEWLHNEVFLPAVVVIGTEAAKARVRETNGLSLAELFAPFGGFARKVSATYQGLERQMRLEGLRMRFVDAEAASQWSAAHAEQVSAWMVESSAPTGPQEPLVPPSPWYEQWRLAMFRSLRWSEHEGLDQPVAALLVVSSKEEDPVMQLEKLLHSSHMPPLCTQGVLDPVPGRASVLLHDASDPQSPSAGELKEKLERVQARFTPHLVVAVQINRGPCEEPARMQDFFGPFVAALSAPPPPPPPEGEPALAQVGLGRALGKEDLDALADAAADVLVKTAVPWMQQQLQSLEAQISQSRKGFRNQLKYLWRRPRESQGGGTQQPLTPGPSTAAPDPQEAGVVYPLQTVEGQMRLAGDLAFLLRDYETALGYFRSVVSDFKQDRSWKHTAGAYEMWGLCAYVSGAPRGEWSRCMESAYDHYLQATAGRHAIRAVALHQAMVTDYREAAARLVKVNSDISDAGPRSALILEQAGQLYCQAGYMRKGTFYMVLAGHSFNKLGFKRLALGSYRAVAERYAAKQWFHITDHFHFTMARQAFGLSLYQESMAHFMKLLNSSGEKRVSIQAERESTYLKEFLFVARNWIENCCQDGKPRSLNLKVPRFGPNVLVILPGDVDLRQEEERPLPLVSPGGLPPDDRPPDSEPPSSWERLGELLLPSPSQDDRLELQWRGQHADRIFDSLQRVVAVGAEVTVELELCNPMRVKLELVGARLGGELLTGDPSTRPEPTEEDELFFEAVAESSDDVAFSEQTIVLEPLEAKRVQFVAVPKHEGLLRILHVSWSLSDQVSCARPLTVRGRRLRATAQQRASRVYSQDRRLELRVRQSLPQLRVELEGWPEGGLLAGEVRSCGLIVSGPALPQSLRLTTSHPAFVAFSEVGYEGEVIMPRRLGRLPLRLRADRVGRHNIRFCLLAMAGGEKQWLTLEQQLTVKPCLNCSARPSPSHQASGRLILTCTLENKSLEPLEVRGARCVTGSHHLQIEPCVFGGLRCGPGQTLQLLYALKSEDDSSPEGSVAEEGVVPGGPSPEARLLAASRAAAVPAAGGAPSLADTVDLIFEWAAGSRSGEAFVFGVPRERPGAAPCPLDLHLMAPESAVLVPGLMVPVTLRVRNASGAGSVAFYYAADIVPEFAWLGCERSEIIRLEPFSVHTATLYAHFVSPGVFNLNRLRLFVVAVPPGPGAVPASEQAPLAFQVPFERLIHVRREDAHI